MSSGSMTAAAASGNGARITSPTASWSTHCKVLDMNADGRTIEYGIPDSRTACSERMW